MTIGYLGFTSAEVDACQPLQRRRPPNAHEQANTLRVLLNSLAKPPGPAAGAVATRYGRALCLPFRHDTFGSQGYFGGPIMRTTVLAYAIALVGLITMVASFVPRGKASKTTRP